MQCAAIVSPTGLERTRVADLLRKNGFELVSKEPLDNYDSRDIRINLFVDFESWDTILTSYEVYRVVGPDGRHALFKLEDTPWYIKVRYYATAGLDTLRGLFRYYLLNNKQRSK